jgi:HD-like signal output (HDOD) protein
VHAFSQFEGAPLGGFSLEALWRHSQNTARLAQAIACMEDAEQKIVDEAFVGGLLHDIGKLVLAANFAADYARILEIGRQGTVPLVAAEENTFGANHADIGGYLLGLWGLPVPVVEAIALHHSPGQSTHNGFSPLTAVHAANALVDFEPSPDKVFIPGMLDSAYLNQLGLEDRIETWRSKRDPNR